jgi:hypothetical protein
MPIPSEYKTSPAWVGEDAYRKGWPPPGGSRLHQLEAALVEIRRLAEAWADPNVGQEIISIIDHLRTRTAINTGGLNAKPN